MNFSVFVVLEGSTVPAIPVCRIADPEITREVVQHALDKTTTRSRVEGVEHDAIRTELCRQEIELRGVLAMI